jgi:hypothetical protein
MLKTYNVKSWFRAYLNLGLIEKILGHDRLIPCVAGKGFAFIDPWSDVWACNVRTDLPLGNLARQSWQEIMDSDTAKESIAKVAQCKQNCWMVTTARTAMRSELVPQLPKAKPLAWVVKNKLKLAVGRSINFDEYIDYGRVMPSPHVPRVSRLLTKEKVSLTRGRDTPARRYPLKVFENR